MHTPGPWSVTVLSKGQPIPLGYVTILGIAEHRPAGEIGRGNRFDEDAANGRLAEAAPELLAALKAMLEDYGHLPGSEDVGFVKLARAAIAKAEGKREAQKR